MDYRKEAARRLRQYAQARCAVTLLPGQIRALEARLYEPGMAQMGQTGRSTRTREDWQVGALEELRLLKHRLEQTTAWVEATDMALATLSDEERQVLGLYLDPAAGSVDDLCEVLSAERATVYRKRDRALDRFTWALYGPVQ